MATIRNWLNNANFNWKKGLIIHQPTDGGSPGWSCPVSAEIVGVNDEVLDREFDSGFGGPECPRFVAEDDRAIYFPSQYDGSTTIEVVLKDIKSYLNIENKTPYPGG